MLKSSNVKAARLLIKESAAGLTGVKKIPRVGVSSPNLRVGYMGTVAKYQGAYANLRNKLLSAYKHFRL